MSEWKTYRADEFCKTVTDGTHDSPKPQPCGRYLITSKHLKSFGIDFSSANRISEEDYQKIVKRSNVEQYDILFSMIGTVGNIHRVTAADIDYAVKNMGIFKLGGDNVKSLWLYYWLQSPQAKEYIKSRISGSTQGYLTLGSLREFPVSVPPLAEQKRIADILSAIDDKIELNRRINANLEQQAQALYKSWFVDADTTGWGTKKLADFFNVITGKKDANYSTKDGVYPFFTCSQDILKAPNYSFEGAAILLAGNGDFNVKRYIGKFEAYQRTYVLIPFEKRYHSFLYLLIKYHLQEITGGSRGSVIKFITKGNIADFTFTMPPYSIDEKLSLFDSLFNEIDKNITEINNLSTIRDTLLPKLMSGEITV